MLLLITSKHFYCFMCFWQAFSMKTCYTLPSVFACLFCCPIACKNVNENATNPLTADHSWWWTTTTCIDFRSVFSGLSRYRPCTLHSKKCTKNTQRFVKSPRWAGLINQVMHRLQYTKRMVCYIKDYFLFKISLTFSFYWELLVLLSIHNIQRIKSKFSFLIQWFSTGLDLT